MIRIDRPPNFDQVLAVFPRAGDEGVLFAYGEDIFNPSRIKIPDWLLKHEYRHCARQFSFEGGAENWWLKYLRDDEFRYHEELLAHTEEFAARLKGVRDRNEAARILQQTAQRLIAPLYNYQPPKSLAVALRDLRWMSQ